MSLKHCPVCSQAYTDSYFCTSCSWDLSNDVYWVGEMQIIERRLQNRLELAKSNWSKVKYAKRYENTAIHYSTVISKAKVSLQQLKESYPELQKEIEAILNNMRRR